MRLIADLHVHSKYSRATSRDLDLCSLHRAAVEKGLSIVGTGDFIHPGWRQEIIDQLEPAEPGFYRLKPEVRRAAEHGLPAACRGEVRFVLQVEISNIYKKHGRTRKNHNLVFVPSLEAAQKLSDKLAAIGNISSDGRPILGLDARDLLEITLECDPLAFLVPAHIWTPWFSMLGSQSGFDSIEECFADLSDHVFAVETGLSSDPPMNWRLTLLDRVTLISNSDAHSAGKLGREATVFDIEYGYEPLLQALRTGEGLNGTLEFFPEEGKYHADGHRRCGVRMTPEQTLACQGRCPVCDNPITVGVLSRVVALADRAPGTRPAKAADYRNLVPLTEVISQVCGTGIGSGKVRALVDRLLGSVGPELVVLQDAALEDLRRVGGPALAEAIRRVRAGEVEADAGYDGQYGKITVFDATEQPTYAGQLALVQSFVERSPENEWRREQTGAPSAAPTPRPARDGCEATGSSESRTAPEGGFEPNPEQRRAIHLAHGPLLIVAGPGSGKTRTVVSRIAHLITARVAKADEVLALTFTNQAVLELRERLTGVLSATQASLTTVSTFHGFGASLLREHGTESFELLDDGSRHELVREALGDGARRRDADRAVARFSSAKQCVDPRAELSAQAQLLLAFDRYEHLLRTRNLLDVDDLVIRAVQLLEQSEQVAERVRQRYRCICIDEYQDVNDAQATLIRLLAQGGKGLCVIGDPDQAIYGFRGARPDHFARFSQMYEGAQIVRLSATYRLTRPVLQVASSVLAEPLALTSDRAGRRVQIVACPTPDSEAEQIVVRIEQLMGGTSLFAVDSGRGAHTASEGLGFGDIAILTRTKAQHAAILGALARSGIPCKTVGDDEPHDPRSEKVGLMTLHASKGRQFEVVFVAGVERGLLPLQIEGLPCDPDEERRLLYVGITRTRRLCIISYAKRRMLYGRRLPGQPCHFLRGLPEEAVERHQVTLRGRGNTSAQLSLFAD